MLVGCKTLCDWGSLIDLYLEEELVFMLRPLLEDRLFYRRKLTLQ
jgi:hypothetical protein